MDDTIISLVENPVLFGMRGLEKALDKWYETGQQDVSAVLDAVVEVLRNEREIIAPVEFPEGMFDEEMSDTYVEIEPEAFENVLFHVMETDVGDCFAAFTSMMEVELGDPTDTMPYPLKDMVEMILEDPDLEGLIINPWGRQILLQKEVLADMMEIIRPSTEDEINLDIGAKAYDNGDYETAVKYYRMAAEAGNVTAMSNLGYCYYYGRSIPVDKEKARMCWEKAAILGDVCAIYKIADMYQNGDLPRDIVFAKHLYMQAFRTALQNPVVESFPDVCLRLLKYCRENFEEEDLRNLASDAVEGFAARVKAGDRFSGKLLKEAEQIRKELM